jgi:hypothetical protein
VSGQTPQAEPLSPQRYKVQFTAGEEYVKLVEEAQALLSHTTPRATLDEIQLRAMRALVVELKRRKHAVMARPHTPSTEEKDADRSTAERESAQKSDPKSESELPPFDAESGQQSEVESEHRSDAESGQSEVEPEYTRRRGRHVPAAVRRAVFERDEGRLHLRRHLRTPVCRDSPPRAPPPAGLRAGRRAHRGESHPALPRPQCPRSGGGLRKRVHRACSRCERTRTLGGTVRRLMPRRHTPRRRRPPCRLRARRRRSTHADVLGRRYAETHRLELHDLRAFARDGKHTKENLTRNSCLLRRGGGKPFPICRRCDA